MLLYLVIPILQAPMNSHQKLGKKLFLNSGCWVSTDTELNGKMRYVNSFIYLDESGAYILTWRGSGKINCIESFT